MNVTPHRNDFRVGRETPLGTALRRFWIPACLTSDIAEPDSDPYRVRLLGDSFVAFRDTAGRVGLLDEACPHRKASLVMGRNENGGLACLWHQWKFAVDGEILETPNVEGCTYKERLRANAYPVRESGGIIWAYLGPKDLEPPFPEFQWATVPAENLLVVPVDLDCNFVVALEGLVDSSHVGLLHVNMMAVLAETAGGDRTALTTDKAPSLDLEMTDFGFHYAAIRTLNDETGTRHQVRITAFVAPFVCFTANGNTHLSVPQDDTHTRFYNIVYSPDHKVGTPEMAAFCGLLGMSDEQLSAGGVASTMPGLGPLGQRNIFNQDRQGMREGRTYSGVPGLTVEDAIMTVSSAQMDAHALEHLAPADIAIVRLRRYFNDCAKAVADGQQPIGVVPETVIPDISGKSAVLADGVEWRSLTPAHRALAPAPTRSKQAVKS